MAFFDVFNGDADGICALTQLHLAEPRSESTLVTGVKRDISLLKRVNAGAGDHVNVLDISLDKNRDDLQRILDAGASVYYADHHYAGEIPDAANLDAQINTSADVCTSLLVNGRLKNRYAEWAVVGAFGDNLKRSAHTLAQQLNLSPTELEDLEALGTYMNYNGYGASLEDLYFTPEDLFLRVSQHSSPLAFIRDSRVDFETLQDGYHGDMSKAAQTSSLDASEDHAALFILPDEAWARRVSGVWSNDLANQNPDRAHAVLTARQDGTFLISVRAPLNRKTGADELCRSFPTGGGRAAAAGINALPADQLDQFEQAFVEQFRA